MYAVVQTGGKQYRVALGQMFNVEKIDAEVGSEIVLDKVLLLKDEQGVKTGEPFVQAKVVCEVLEQAKDQKIIVFKHKKRKDYRKKQGHRQMFTRLKVKAIEA